MVIVYSNVDAKESVKLTKYHFFIKLLPFNHCLLFHFVLLSIHGCF